MILCPIFIGTEGSLNYVLVWLYHHLLTLIFFNASNTRIVAINKVIVSNTSNNRSKQNNIGGGAVVSESSYDIYCSRRKIYFVLVRLCNFLLTSIIFVSPYNTSVKAITKEIAS